MLRDIKNRMIFMYEYYKRKKYDEKCLPNHKLFNIINNRTKQINLLVYGDSVSERVSNSDTNKKKLFEMIHHKIGNDISYYHITHSAYYADIYNLYIRYILSLDIKIDEIIVPINLRNFSPQWDYNPIYQCMSHISALKLLLENKNIAIRDEQNNSLKTVNDFFESEVNYIGSPYKYIHNFQNIVMSAPKTENDKIERKKIIFTYHYMNKIDQYHHKFKPFEDMVELCNKNKIKLFLYLTPINYEGGVKFVGKSFSDNLRSNAATVCNQILKSVKADLGALTIKDFSMLLTSDFFFNREETTEHLNENGRILLAENIINTK